jgi:S1-C subfamily serine protease
MVKKQPNYKKIVAFWVAVFVVGGLAGALSSQLLLPWLAGISPFSKIGWISRVKDGTTIINRTEKVTISEDLAYLDAIGKLTNSMIAIRCEKHYRLINKKQVLLAKPEVLTEGSGFILTSDGYVVTALTLVPEAATRCILIREGREVEAQVVKRDVQNSLALIKTTDSNLPVVSMGDSTSIKLGEAVFLIGEKNIATSTSQFVHLGYIRTIAPDLSVDFSESQLANGSPLGNLRGEVIGLNLINSQGVIKIVAEDKIRNLLK